MEGISYSTSRLYWQIIMLITNQKQSRSPISPVVSKNAPPPFSPCLSPHDKSSLRHIRKSRALATTISIACRRDCWVDGSLIGELWELVGRGGYLHFVAVYRNSEGRDFATSLFCAIGLFMVTLGAADVKKRKMARMHNKRKQE